MSSPTNSTAWIPSSLCASPRSKSRRKATEPFHWKGRTTRSESTPTTPAVFTATWHGLLRTRLTLSVPKLIPFDTSGAVTTAKLRQAAAIVFSRVFISSSLISSAKRWTAPAAKR